MRHATAGLLLIVGCSSQVGREEKRTPEVDDVSVLPATDSPVESAPTEIASPSSGAGPTHEPAPTTGIERPSCPMPSSACPDGCAPITGRRFDEAKQCDKPIVLGCLPVRGRVYSMAADLGCSKRDDGLVYMGSIATLRPALRGPEWGRCTEEDKAAWGKAPLCQSR